jgi:hypothetical protein
LFRDGAWSSEAAEKLCCEHHTQVLRDIGASLAEIAWFTWNSSNCYWGTASSTGLFGWKLASIYDYQWSGN